MKAITKTAVLEFSKQVSGGGDTAVTKTAVLKSDQVGGGGDDSDN